MSDVPRFAVRPPLRCCERLRDPRGVYCARPATFQRPGVELERAAFVCTKHARPGDLPIDDEALFRRVSVTADILFSGVSLIPGIAHADAVDRLERAIAEVGGVINLHACRSEIGRGTRQAPIGPQKPGRPRQHP